MEGLKDEPTTELVIPEVVEPDELERPAPVPERDLLAAALRSLKSLNTRRTYLGHWTRFAAFHGQKPGPFIHWFLSHAKADALDLVHEFREHLEVEGKSVQTIAGHMRAITSMVDRWHRAEAAPWTLKGLVSAPTPERYSDVQGVSEAGLAAMLAAAKSMGTVEGDRDYAVLTLLHDSALRRREVVSLDLHHWRPADRTVLVWSKGKAQGVRTPQPVSKRSAEAIEAWVRRRGPEAGPLFCRVPLKVPREGISGSTVRRIVDRAAKTAGLEEDVSPHRLRHAGITYFARRVKDPELIRRFARHTQFDTTLIYIHAADNSVRDMLDAQIGDDE